MLHMTGVDPQDRHGKPEVFHREGKSLGGYQAVLSQRKKRLSFFLANAYKWTLPAPAYTIHKVLAASDLAHKRGFPTTPQNRKIIDSRALDILLRNRHGAGKPSNPWICLTPDFQAYKLGPEDSDKGESDDEQGSNHEGESGNG